MNTEMTGGQLAQIYRIAKEQGCGIEKTDALIKSGILAEVFAGEWDKTKRLAVRQLGAVPSIASLTTITGRADRNKACERALRTGAVWKDEDFEFTLHFDLPTFCKAEGTNNCICSLTLETEELEIFITNLKQYFGVNQVILHSTVKGTVVEVEGGTRKSFHSIKAPDTDGCHTYPVFKGMGMTWQFDDGRRKTEVSE